MPAFPENYIFTHEKLEAAFLLAMVGGFLDAYTYLACGGVFANAQTGNLVLLGITIVNGNLSACWLYFTPIIAFALGVIITRFACHKLSKKQFISWQQPLLLLEIIILVFVFFQPNLPNTTINIIISFISSLQMNTFRSITGTPYASTMCTGNLRSAFEHFSNYLFTADKMALKHTMRYLMIILFFCFGCSMGAISVKFFHKQSILACAVLLLPLLFMLTYENYRLHHKNSVN